MMKTASALAIVTTLMATSAGADSVVAPNHAVEACKKAPALTPLEIQAIQSREVEAAKEVTFASVMSVFQDLGYIILSADVATGFITAKSSTTSKVDWIFTGNQYNTNTNATAFIEPVAANLTRIRLNFVTATQTSKVYGQAKQQDVAILDPTVYQAAFEKIDTAIFVRNGTKPMAAQEVAPTTVPSSQAAPATGGASQSPSGSAGTTTGQ